MIGLCLFAAGVAASDREVGGVPGAVIEQLYRLFHQQRKHAELPTLAESVELERVATGRARDLAAADPDRRLNPERGLAAYTESEPSLSHRSVVEMIDVQQDASDPVALALAPWTASRSNVRLLLDGRLDAVGLAAATGNDGALISVALFSMTPSAYELPALRSLMAERINGYRSEYGVPTLDVHAGVLAAAQRRSETAVGHRPVTESLGPAERLELGGIEFSSVTQLVATSRNSDQAVTRVLERWLEESSKRNKLMSERYRQIGVGVAADSRGALYFTVMLVEPH
jgi:uncharacterized protein YkwD